MTGTVLTLRLGVIAAAASLVVACGGDDDGGGGLVVDQAVTAAAGATLASADGRISVIIPPGALSADTRVLVERRSGLPDPGGNYQLGQRRL